MDFRIRHQICLLVTLALMQPSFGFSQDWPRFLGPDGDAKSADVVPTKWDERTNLNWKLELAGKGSSSPIIVGDKIFVTSFSGEVQKRTLQCVDKKTGKEIWKKEFAVENREDRYAGYITEHGYASNTPVSDGKNVFVFFGKGGVHCFDLAGEKKWTVDVGQSSSNRRWGSAASLVLFKDLVIVNAAEESNSLFGLDKSTGQKKWAQEVSMLELAYGTPKIISVNDKHRLMINVPGEIWALDPANGKMKWYASNPMSGNVSPSIIFDGKVVYGFGGYQSKGSLAVETGGKDDVSKTKKKWSSSVTSYVATPLLHEGKFYWIDDRGIANSSNASDGESVYRQRVKGLTGRPVYASPVLIGKYIYVVTRKSGTIVYEPGDQFKEVARNQFASDTTDFNASPAVSENRIYLRSNKALYCVGTK